MGKLVTIIGPSGIGKTALVRALTQARVSVDENLPNFAPCGQYLNLRFK